MPVWRHCAPCALNYDAVLKVETMQADFEAMKEKIPQLANYSLSWLQKSIQDRDAEDAESSRLLATLSPKEREGLIERYELDFELFDYNRDDF